jgi:hypothetical protein
MPRFFRVPVSSLIELGLIELGIHANPLQSTLAATGSPKFWLVSALGPLPANDKSHHSYHEASRPRQVANPRVFSQCKRVNFV